MKLKELISGLDIIKVSGPIECDISGLAYHHSKILLGSLFVAIKGEKFDGHKFIPDAITRGAKVVVSEQNFDADQDSTFIIVKDSRKALAVISANFFGNPSEKMKVIGITGTNGKTTIAYLLESIFEEGGFLPAVIGTVEHRFSGRRLKADNTTPESYELQKLLAEMAELKVGACAMEVSSHALAMSRVYKCNFDGVVFTNLTPEHLDFHRNIENYFSAKLKLFNEYLPQSSKTKTFAAINIDDPYGKRIALQQRIKRLITYSTAQTADVTAKNISCTIAETTMDIKTPEMEFKCSSGLIGQFNVYNILAASAVATGLSIPRDAIRKGIEKINFIPGRLEKVPNDKGITAFVDYAHTPAALENVMTSVRGFLANGSKLILVFGCGGARDRKKRPMMGKIAASYADATIITNDNPRTEDPKAIVNEILAGITSAPCEIIYERKDAIAKAVKKAKRGDIIVVAGKGHEDYQIFGTSKQKFDDKETLKQFLA